MKRSRTNIDKVVVIGLDGLEPQIVATLLEAGELPNFARLATEGRMSQVATTSPAQTPVAWSTFATGVNPGGHGIFDFITRDPKTYQPGLALNRHERKSAWLPPKAINLRRGEAVWDVLANAGIASQILRCPCNYPPKLDKGRMLAGMGVPDLRGGMGTAIFYSTAEAIVAKEAERVVQLSNPSENTFKTVLIGPRDPKTGGDLTLDLTLAVDRERRALVVRSAGDPAELIVREGEWSDWLRVKFKAGALQTIRGSTRFHLVRIEPELELYASPIQFDAEFPLFPISSPSHYAQELVEEIGPYHTAGMIEDHAGLNNERIDEYAFLDQCATAWREREAMLMFELERFDKGLLYCLFDTPDRVQHMFWRYREPNHPANKGNAPASDFLGVIDDQYRRSDAIVGKALEFVDDKTLLIVLSDHGFGSFQRGVDLNRWLYEQNLLAFRDGVDPRGDVEAIHFPKDVDWSRTRAFALGLGGIFLNLEGREGEGIVKLDEAESLKREIARGLTGLVDPARGSVAIRGVKTREELYQGPFAGESPDLVVHFERGHRVSWSSSLGGIGIGLFEDNVKKWSGDHIVDPALVPGVLLMNRPFQGENPRLEDLAPTVLDALGVPKGRDMEGNSLTS